MLSGAGAYSGRNAAPSASPASPAVPPQTSISCPVHTAVWSRRPLRGPAGTVCQRSATGSYIAPAGGRVEGGAVGAVVVVALVVPAGDHQAGAGPHRLRSAPGRDGSGRHRDPAVDGRDVGGTVGQHDRRLRGVGGVPRRRGGGGRRD